MNIIEKLFSLLGLRASPESLTKKAATFAARDDVLASVEQYKRALTIDPLFIPAYDGLGKVYFRMGFREEADREFAIADGLEHLQAGTIDLSSSIKLGNALYEKGLYKQIAALLEPVLKDSSPHPDLLKVVGLAQKSLGNDKKAKEHFKTGLERWPRDGDFYQYLGALEVKSGKKDEGERLMRMATLLSRIDADPSDAGARMDMAKLFLARNLYTDAAEYLRQAVGIDSRNVDYWYQLGECYHKAGQNPAALDALVKASRVGPADPRPLQLLAKVYQFMGKFSEAKAAKELAAVLEGGATEVKNPAQSAKFIKYLLSKGMNSEAQEHLTIVLEKWPDSLDLKLIKGRLLFKEQKYAEALQMLKEVASEKESLAEPHIWMAMSYQKLGDSMSALAEGQLATRLAPKSSTAHKILGDILREQKKFSMAENAYETAEHLKKPSKKD